MRRTLFGLMLVASVVLVRPAAAQAPDLSGTWLFAADKSSGQPTVPRVFNPIGLAPTDSKLVIKQTPTELRVDMGNVTLVYALDGSERNISAAERPGYPKAKAVWDGNKLVIAVTQNVFFAAKQDYVNVTGREVYQLDSGVLTIEKTQNMPNGTTQSTKLVYTKGAP
jgi:hypothetical protein